MKKFTESFNTTNDAWNKPGYKHIEITNPELIEAFQNVSDATGVEISLSKILAIRRFEIKISYGQSFDRSASESLRLLCSIMSEVDESLDRLPDTYKVDSYFFEISCAAEKVGSSDCFYINLKNDAFF